MPESLNITVIGLSLTSSWGNGHAAIYRALLKALAQRGHRILFLEQAVPWYRDHRDLPEPAFCRLGLYDSVEQLKNTYESEIRKADAVIVGSCVRDGVQVGQWITQIARASIFYDIDTPITLAKLRRQDYEYLHPELIEQYDLYLSFTGGALLQYLEETYRSPAARPLYCSADPGDYYPQEVPELWDMGYLGTYSDDRQAALDKLLILTARHYPGGRFVAAGPQYPPALQWPNNIERIEHLPPAEHCRFYNAQRFTLNVTRSAMAAAGFSPSIRLFEAAACGRCIISDYWPGLETFFEPGEEILIADSHRQTVEWLSTMPDSRRTSIGRKARKRMLDRHTAAHRAAELERHLLECRAYSSHRVSNENT
ncbi:MAG: glycosyltransferase [Planctomycetaceae bacterium]|nr:glycosyltransferase [Planctomycetaceae bacterium]